MSRFEEIARLYAGADEAGRINLLASVAAELDRTERLLVVAIDERDEAQEAARNYHEAWQGVAADCA